METSVQSAQRYRARAARRPFLFWWQAFFLLGVVLLLWSQLPVTAVLYETRVFAPLPAARASYVVLTPAYAAQALARTRTSWAAGAQGKVAAEIELGAVDLREELKPPAFLEQGARYPGAWLPAEVEPLPQPLPDLGVSTVPAAPAAVRWPAEPQGVRPVVDRALAAADFTFPLPAGPLPERTGACRFYLETEADGSVAHLLLLSPWNGSATVLEQALARGRARGAARGFVELSWSFPK